MSMPCSWFDTLTTSGFLCFIRIRSERDAHAAAEDDAAYICFDGGIVRDVELDLGARVAHDSAQAECPRELPRHVGADVKAGRPAARRISRRRAGEGRGVE